MSELSQHIQVARVNYQPAVAQAAFSALALSPEIHGPGLSGSDAVQVATYLATLRDVVATFDPHMGGPSARLAIYDKAGRWLAFRELNASQAGAIANQMARDDQKGILVVGDGPFGRFATTDETFTASDGSTFIVPKWGKKLALAIDEVLVRISKVEQGGNTPPSVQTLLNVVLPLAPIAVIVTGAALAIIGSVAAWRYLDPDFRRDVLLVKQAADDYAQRLGIYTKTGNMPPPSMNEQKAVGAVESMAKNRATVDWWWGAGIAGGLVVGTLISVKIASGE